MKPMGMTADFRIVRPTSEEDALWDAVEQAVAANWSVERFRVEAAKAWEHYRDEQAKADAKAWRSR